MLTAPPEDGFGFHAPRPIQSASPNTSDHHTHTKPRTRGISPSVLPAIEVCRRGWSGPSIPAGSHRHAAAYSPTTRRAIHRDGFIFASSTRNYVTSSSTPNPFYEDRRICRGNNREHFRPPARAADSRIPSPTVKVAQEPLLRENQIVSPQAGEEAVGGVVGVVGVAGQFALEGSVFERRADDQDAGGEGGRDQTDD